MSFRNKIALSCLLATLCLLAVVTAAPSKDRDAEIDLSHMGEKIFGEPDEKNGEALRFLTADNITGNPEELGNYAEGDILFVNSDLRNGVRAPSKRWPNGRVPYKIAGHFTQSDLQFISQAMDQYHEKTCIRFVPHAGERNYIRLTSGNTGCWSSVGMVGGEQDVNLQSPGCLFQVGTPIHEMMHALGFQHEQNREDRDAAVSINWGNVKPGTVENFAKATAGTTDAMNVPYDYDSVLHYSANAFSTNGQPTIVSKQGSKPNMGQRRGFSEGDLLKLNRMYCGGGNAQGSSNLYNNNKPSSTSSSSSPAAPNKNKPNFWELIFNAFRQPMSPADVMATADEKDDQEKKE